MRSLFRSIKQSNSQIFVGLTGGIGSGKSTVAELLREAGYTVLSSDAIAREITDTSSDIREELAREFGSEIVSDGALDRKTLSAIVFGPTPEHEQALRKLNAIVHPYVVQELHDRLKERYTAGENCVFNETALLFEAGLEDCYDYIVVVDAPEEQRVQRVAASRDITEEEVRRRIAMQMPASEKVQAADFVVNNSGTAEDLKKAVRFILAVVPALKALD